MVAEWNLIQTYKYFEQIASPQGSNFIFFFISNHTQKNYNEILIFQKQSYVWKIFLLIRCNCCRNGVDFPHPRIEEDNQLGISRDLRLECSRSFQLSKPMRESRVRLKAHIEFRILIYAACGWVARLLLLLLGSYSRYYVHIARIVSAVPDQIIGSTVKYCIAFTYCFIYPNPHSLLLRFSLHIMYYKNIFLQFIIFHLATSKSINKSRPEIHSLSRFFFFDGFFDFQFFLFLE